MEEQKQLKEEKQSLIDKLLNFWGNMIDYTIRSGIILVCLIVPLSYIIVVLLHQKFYWVLIPSMILSLLFNPFLNKIKIGHLVVDKYVIFLKRIAQR